MARKLIVEIVGDSRSYERALGRSERATKGFGNSMRHGARRAGEATAAIVAAGVAIGTVASRQFNAFEDSMHKIIGLVGVSSHQVEEWGDSILELSTEVAKSPTELADALFFVTSAGLRGEAAMETLRTSALASAAGLGETLTVADAVTSAMNAYGQANLDAATSADVLVATVREGKTAADALAPAIGIIAPLAAELGVSFDQVGASIAGMTRSGTSAMKATTALRAVFSTFVKTQPKSRKAFESVGLNVDKLRDTLGKPGGLLKVLKLVQERFEGNTVALARAFPNVRALTAVLQLVGKNADAVEKIFKNMTDTTGSVQKAFEAISEDEGFQFQRTLEALRVVGIRLGAVLEPLANLIARSLTKALQVVGDFIGDFQKARTIRAKLDVIWEGIKTAGTRLTEFFTRAVNAIDWKAVFAGAGGIAEELEKRIAEVDWSNVGRQIGGGFKKAADFVGPALQNLTEILSKALHDLDWEAVGVAAGPGIITAMLSAFHALLDPAFWARNWQLALSVAIDALGFIFPETFAIKKLIAIMVKPFARLIGPLARAIGTNIARAFTAAGSAAVDAAGRLSERLATALAHDLISLPARLAGLVRRIFGPFFKAVSDRFEKLRESTRFVIRLIGIAAAIRTVERFVHFVGGLFTGLVDVIRDAWNRVFNWLRRKAIQTALLIIEPFTHIPRRLGGGTFQDLKKGWQRTLTRMDADSLDAANKINSNLDTIKDKTVTIKFEQSGFPRGFQPGGERGPAPEPTPRRRPRRTGGGDGDGGDGGETGAERQARLERERKARAERARKAAEKATTAYENLIDALELKLDIAKTTRRFSDDLAAYKAIRQAILDRIAVVGKTTALARDLFTVTQDMAQAIKDNQQAQQFLALGLTAEGEKRVASSGALLRRAKSMLANLKGTVMDTKKNRDQLRRIISVLKANFKTAGKEVRQAILGMLNDIAGGTEQAAGPITKTKGLNTKRIIEGLGLSRQEADAIRQRLSHFNTAGRALSGSGSRAQPGRFVDDRPIVVNTTINLDGQRVATNTTRHQQRGRRRNPRQKRGPATSSAA